MNPKFELEQQILGCWNVCEDLDLLVTRWNNLTDEERKEFILGLKQLYQLKFEQAFETFEKLSIS
jgi:hypothetical protein